MHYRDKQCDISPGSVRKKKRENLVHWFVFLSHVACHSRRQPIWRLGRLRRRRRKDQQFQDLFFSLLGEFRLMSTRPHDVFRENGCWFSSHLQSVSGPSCSRTFALDATYHLIFHSNHYNHIQGVQSATKQWLCMFASENMTKTTQHDQYKQSVRPKQNSDGELWVCVNCSSARLRLLAMFLAFLCLAGLNHSSLLGK